jgi:hypothetical protein
MLVPQEVVQDREFHGYQCRRLVRPVESRAEKPKHRDLHEKAHRAHGVVHDQMILHAILGPAVRNGRGSAA